MMRACYEPRYGIELSGIQQSIPSHRRYVSLFSNNDIHSDWYVFAWQGVAASSSSLSVRAKNISDFPLGKI